ncbi:MAG: UDP-glucuronic acid decarboxylase family protein [Capsulimonas sp.]|jgi:dTDP-glucose 4,6-dehydratase|uniref:UDP-glucuronic acid decarboxylase family protein n=1 Tax=Capsulimonas sp. TaxID=2494211 RepID=UPI0032675129|nr:NAD-dependent epimerase/dehydratase family protein [Capsulimonas sp.]
MARAIITGGAGFLGSHLSDRLLAEGYEVVAVDNLITGNKDNIEHLASNPRFQFIEQDIIQPYTVDGPVDLIYHFASPASPVDYLELPLETLLVGSVGTHNTLELAKAKGSRFLVASTSEVYGDPTVHPQTEEYWGNVNPNGTRAVYDEAKRYAEAVTFAYRRLYNLDAKIVRIFNTYGPRMRVKDGRVVPAFISQALRGEPLTVFGNGQQTRSFCFVSDLIDGIYKLSVSDQSGPINVGNPVERTMIQFAHEILKATGSQSEITYLPLPTADDPKQRNPDITKARALLGWEPKISLEEGLTSTIEYFRTKLA